MKFKQLFINTVEKQGIKAIKYVQPVEVASASGEMAGVFSQMRRDFGSVLPLVLLHSPVPALFYGVWAVLRESLLVGNVPRRLKEAVSGAVSKINECPFCVDAHTLILHAVSEHEVAEAIVQGQSVQIKDPEVRAMVEWASANRRPGAPILVLPPFAPEGAPEIIGVAVAFHYLNRMANIFLAEFPLPVPSRLAGLRGVVKKVGGSLIKDLIRPATSPGASLRFLPEAPLPADLAWAAPRPTVAGAFARFAAAVEAAGQQALPAEVRELVSQQVNAWQGEEPGLSRRWLEEAIAGLDETHKPAARLALLAALASYQVDEGVIEAFRSQYPGDDKLIGAAAWASFTATRKVGGWLSQPPGPHLGDWQTHSMGSPNERSYAHDIH